MTTMFLLPSLSLDCATFPPPPNTYQVFQDKYQSVKFYSGLKLYPCERCEWVEELGLCGHLATAWWAFPFFFFFFPSLWYISKKITESDFNPEAVIFSIVGASNLKARGSASQLGQHHKSRNFYVWLQTSLWFPPGWLPSPLLACAPVPLTVYFWFGIRVLALATRLSLACCLLQALPQP